MGWWYSYLRPWVARGYRPPPRARPQPVWVFPAPAGLGPGCLLAFCPTFVGDGNWQSQRDTLAELAAQLREVARGAPGTRCLLVVGMQHRAQAQAAAHQRLRELRDALADDAVAFAGFCLAEFGKVKSVNIAIGLAQALEAEALLQIDDDIQLAPGCVQALCRAYRQHGGGLAVGATKLGLAHQNRASRLLRWLKGQTRAATSYPHACCMLLDPRLLAGGIPDRYISDDGYICFHLLRPQEADPLRLLRLVPDARCSHYVGGPAGQSARRIRRMLLNHHVYMADFPADVARFYFREILFPGFWPLGRAPERPAPLRWALQLLYFLWFLAVGLELAARGLLGRPLAQIAWAGFEDRRRPEAPATIAIEEIRP